MFASRDRDQQALNRAVRERLPRDTSLLGATTGGEIDRDGMHGSRKFGVIVIDDGLRVPQGGDAPEVMSLNQALLAVGGRRLGQRARPGEAVGDGPRRW
jgi:hypothetical protein